MALADRSTAHAGSRGAVRGDATRGEQRIVVRINPVDEL